MGYVITTSDSVTSATDAIAQVPGEMRIDLLQRITQAIETGATIDELMLLCLYELTQSFHVDYGAVLLGEGGSLVVMGEYPPQVAVTAPLALEDIPLAQRVLQGRESLQVADTEARDERPPFDALLQA